MVSFGIFSIFAGITVCFLKETFKVDLEDDIPEEILKKKVDIEDRLESVKEEKEPVKENREFNKEMPTREKLSSGEEENSSPVGAANSIPKTRKATNLSD